MICPYSFENLKNILAKGTEITISFLAPYLTFLPMLKYNMGDRE
jgi:hypothetical protein